MAFESIVVENVVFSVRKFKENDFSVTARLWDPSKKIFEHTEHIELLEEEAIEKAKEVAESYKGLSEEEIIADISSKWLLVST